MKLFLKKLTTFASAGLLVAVSIGLHTLPAAAQTGMAMGGMSHGVDSSIMCTTTCTSTSPHENEYLNELEAENDEPGQPFYVLSQGNATASLTKLHSQQARVALEQEPPPGSPPAYITLGVFRA